MPDYVSIGWSSENQLSPECCFEPVTTRHSHSIQYYYRSTRPITWKKHGYYTELGIANITSDEIIPYLSLGHYTILLACGAFADFPLELITNYLGSVLIGFLDLSQINIHRPPKKKVHDENLNNFRNFQYFFTKFGTLHQLLNRQVSPKNILI